MQMILRSRSGNIALINRKRYRKGDSLGERGWIVERIGDRSVDIVHKDNGDQHTLVVPAPK